MLSPVEFENGRKRNPRVSTKRGAIQFLSGAKRHRSLISACFCGLVCLALVWNISMALQEQRRNAAEMACGFT
jgi:hypothetical protein